MPDQIVGWVFVGDDDEDLRRMLRPNAPFCWRDARTQGKSVGQPVLLLQTGGTPRWVGRGHIHSLDYRWKIFGVTVMLDGWIDPPLVARAPESANPDRGVYLHARHWENRTLASRIGLPGFHSRTPYLEEGRDLRLTRADLEELIRQQPALRPYGLAARG